MATIIDYTYFQQGERYVPNARSIDASEGVGSSAQSVLQGFIEKYERVLLIEALGADLYTTLQGIIDAGTLDNVGNEKWKALVDGETYTTVDGDKYVFNGLRGNNKTNSLIADYVYCKYLKEGEIVYTTTGTVKDISKNAISVSATPKYVTAWNSFIKLYQGDVADAILPNIIINRSGDYGLDFYGGQDSIFRCLKDYIDDKNALDAANFPDVPFRMYERKNSMGF